MAWKYDELSPDLQRRVREASAKKDDTPAPPPAVEPEVSPEVEDGPSEDPPTVVRSEREENTLTVWITALGKPRMTQRDKWKKREPVVRYRAYADKIRAAVPPEMLKNVVGCSWVAWLPIPPSWTLRAKLRSAGQLHDQKPDRDNIDKGLCDILFKEDKAVAFGSLEKRWDDGKGPRIALTFHYKMKPTYTVFRERVQEARDGGKLLRLEGYYSTESKKVSDMTIRLLPEGGYDELVKKSLEDYNARPCGIMGALLEKYGNEVDESFIALCVHEQIKAWEKRAGGEASEKSTVLGSDGLEDSGKGYHTKPTDPFLTVVLGAVLVDEVVRSESPKSASGKVGKTVIKNALKNMLPLGRFRGRLNLDLDNVDDVQVIED
jgi:hypothetical protein